MKYHTVKLDKRFAHHDRFTYCIRFSNRMSVSQGPLQFSQAQQWFFDTYGWSAEIRQYTSMLDWVATSHLVGQLPLGKLATSLLAEPPVHCNPHWSWTNGYDDLRIYVAGESELMFFQLSHPIDQ